MDFNGISNNQMGSNEGQANSSASNNASQASGNGIPKRWSFKDAVKEEVNVPSNSSVSNLESTGDPEFDKQWAEMMAAEAEEQESDFVSKNQITPAAELTNIQEEPKAKIEIPKFRSVADIMKGFGNIGSDNEEELDSVNEESSAVNVAENTIPVAETAVEHTMDMSVEPVAEISEVSDTEMVVAAEIESSPVAELETEVFSEPTLEVLEVVDVEQVSGIEVVEHPMAEVSTDVVADWTEQPVMHLEVVIDPVNEVSEIAGVDFADLIAETEVESPAAEFTPEVISETLEAVGLEPAFEINMSPVADSAEEIIAELNNETVAENDFMSESSDTLFNEEFQPIELAGENIPVSETVAPVFVNVEHAWMYAVEPSEPVAESEGIMEETNFNASLPGELPLFSAENNSTINFESETHTHNNHKSEEAMKFELPEYSSIIKVIGVGGGGSNAVNHMYKLGIKGVDFLVCNTDKQALDLSPVPHKIVLGTTLTEGRGAGSIPEVGRNAAIENIEDLRAVLSNNTKMVFITAGMGGGTGTGAAPVISGVARELGILTVGIVTVPFAHEGKKRRQYAEEGIELLKQNVDTLLVIRNDKLREMYGNLKLSDAFAHADDVLTTAAKSIAEIISLTQQINVDFADICTVMRNSGVAIMGSATASGENRAVRAVEMSLNSPLLNDNNIIGARYVLLNIISGSDEITMDELGEITDYIQEAAGQTAEIIKGYGVDPSLGDSVSVTIIATGFQQTNPVNYEYTPKSQPEKVVRQLEEKLVEAPKAEITAPPVAETEMNPLEPFLVSKSVEPVAETKTEWTSSTSVEFEIVNTSQEIVEPVSEFVPEANDSFVNEISSAIEETFTEEVVEPTLVIKEEIKAELDPQEAAKKAEQEEIQRRANERIQKLRDISLKLKSPQVLNEMENEPAYKRRNVNLENVPHSSESQVSRFTLTENEEKKIEIRPNNSFLHDNVD